MHRNAGSIFILDKTKIGKIDFKKVVVNKSKPNKIDDKVSKLFIHRSMGGREGDLLIVNRNFI